MEDLNQLDDHLKCGLRNFLCADDIEVKEDSKTISFEKTPNEETIKSDMIYGKILIRLIANVISKKLPDIQYDDYEVCLPYCQEGLYVERNFTYISPSQIEQHKAICSSIESAYI